MQPLPAPDGKAAFLAPPILSNPGRAFCFPKGEQ